MTSPTDTPPADRSGSFGQTGISIFIDSAHHDVALVDLIAFVDNDFENAGHDLVREHPAIINLLFSAMLYADRWPPDFHHQTQVYRTIRTSERGHAVINARDAA